MIGPGTKVDRYELGPVIGRGAIATVFRARHIQLQSEFAIKVLGAGRAHMAERLVQEGRVQSALRHRNIVSVTDVIDCDGRPALVMELIRGPTLSQFLDAFRRPPLSVTLSLIRDIARGIRVAHGRGMVHRDLKPSNVLIANDNGQLVPKIADFGIAKATAELGSAMTRTGVVMGTPEYMAPEQIRDASKVDFRADLFALGTIFYEMVCGKPPFLAPDIISIYRAIESGDYVPADQVVPGLPGPVANAIHSLLRHNREERVQGCEQLLELLDDPLLPRTVASLSEVSVARYLWGHQRMLDNLGGPSTAIPTGGAPLSDDGVRPPTLGGPNPPAKASPPAPQAPVAVPDPADSVPPAVASGPASVVPPAPSVPQPSRPPHEAASALQSEDEQELEDGWSTGMPAAEPAEEADEADVVELPVRSSKRAVAPVMGSVVAAAILLFFAFVGMLALEPWRMFLGSDLAAGPMEPAEEIANPDEPAGEAPAGDADAEELAGTANGDADGKEAADDGEPDAGGADPLAGQIEGLADADAGADVEAKAPAATRSSAAPRSRSAKRSVAQPQPQVVEGRVLLSGDATKVVLSRRGKTYVAPAQVPVGTYKVQVWFDAGEPIESGSIVVPPDGSLTLKCSSFQQFCQ